MGHKDKAPGTGQTGALSSISSIGIIYIRSSLGGSIMNMDRRSFIASSSVVAAAAAAGTAASIALAEEAGFTWPGVEPEIGDADIVETVDTEILICGAGHCGMIAAVSAATEGAKTVVIEKNPTVGTTRSYIGAIGSRAQRELGIEIDKQAVANDLVRYASGRCDQRLINMWANESGETLDWLEEQVAPYGIEMRSEYTVGDGKEGVYDRSQIHHRPILSTTLDIEPVFDEDGACDTVVYWLTKLDQTELNNALVEVAENAGAEFRFETTLVKVVKEDGAVVGAIAQTEAGYVRINASKGVILCCGGYAADAEVYAHLNPADSSGTNFALVQPGCDGSGIRAGIWAGGEKDCVPTAMLFDRGGVAPGVEVGAPYMGYPVWYGSQPFLKLDLNGKRFCNESTPYDVSLHMLNTRKGKLECLIFDSNVWTAIESWDTVSCSRLAPSEAQPATGEGVGEDVFWGWVKEGVRMGIVFECETLEELVDQLQIPAERALESISRYNAACEAGVDDEFGKPAKDLFAVNQPPYYGVRVGSWTLCTLDGLVIDEDCQVLDCKTFDPIPGLYACGNNSGAFFSNNYPELNPGIACGRGMAEARHATLHAIKR